MYCKCAISQNDNSQDKKYVKQTQSTTSQLLLREGKEKWFFLEQLFLPFGSTQWINVCQAVCSRAKYWTQTHKRSYHTAQLFNLLKHASLTPLSASLPWSGWLESLKFTQAWNSHGLVLPIVNTAIIGKNLLLLQI